jgi:hypothetical protein
LKINKDTVYMELARKQLSVEELCSHIGWPVSRFYQMMRRGTAPVKTVGILSHALGTSPEKIVRTEIKLKRKDG